MSNTKRTKNKFMPNPIINNSEKKHIIRIFKNKFKDKDQIKDQIKEQELIKYEFIFPVEEFLSELMKIKRVVMILYNFTIRNLKDNKEKINNIINSNKVNSTIEYDEIQITKEQHQDFNSFITQNRLFDDSPWMILENFLISIFSQYENFLTNQIRLIFKKYPKKLWEDKKLEYKDFVKLNSLDEVQNYYIENEIRWIIWAKTFDQIKIIESKLLDYDKDNRILQKNLPLEWLIELSSRRNLYVHNEGKIHEQYINNCCEWWRVIDRWEIWQRLEIDTEYFDNAFETIYETTLIISYLVWYKVYCNNKDELELVDSYFNSNCLELIDPESPSNINFPIRLLEFVLRKENKLFHKALHKFIFIINLALCYKIKWDEIKLNEILDQEDWSACDKQLEFAYFILKEDYENAIKIMELVSMTKKQAEDAKEKAIVLLCFDEDSYHSLPIFYKIKKEEIFLEKYKEIFKNDYNDEKYYL